MKRREFMNVTAKSFAAGAALGFVSACSTAATVTAPTSAPAADTTASGEQKPAETPAEKPAAQSADMPEITWEMATSWPVSLDTIFGGAQVFAERVGALSGGRFKINAQPAGKLAPGLQVLDAVEAGGVPIGHTASYYYIGKSEACAFGTALPFGLNLQQQNAWLFEGGGLKLLQDVYANKFGVIQWPAGNTACQWGGWFRKEIKTVDDLKGLRMRIPGNGGKVMAKLGVATQTLAGGDIFQALQTGTIDAAEWVGPYDDEKLGLSKAAPFYYYPGWWEAAPSLEVQINLQKWNELPPLYQEIIKSAAHEANTIMAARYDAKSPAALKTLIDSGVKVLPYPPEILEAAEKAAFELYDELSTKDADFKTIYENWKPFRDSVYNFHKYAEHTFSNFSYRALTY